MLKLAGSLAVILLASLLPSGVAASTTSGSPDASALRAEGVRVRWPVKTATAEVTANSWIDVAVHRDIGHKRGDHAARISLVRVSRTGRPIAVVERQTLRSGLFEVKVPNVTPAHYLLTLDVGSRHFQSPIDVPVLKPLSTQAPGPPRQPVATLAPG